MPSDRDFAKQKNEIGKQQKEALKLLLEFIHVSSSPNLNRNLAAFAPKPSCSATARRTRVRRNALALALLAIAVAASASAGERRLAGAPGPADESPKQEQGPGRLGAADAGLRIDLPPALRRDEEATARTAREPGPLRIGFHREAPKAFRGNLLPRLAWVEMGDGALAAVLLVSSPQASSIRLALRADLPSGGALRFFHPEGNERNLLVDPVVTAEELRSLAGAPDAQSAKEAEMFWSPSVPGDLIGVEIRLPSQAARQSASLRLEKIAHRFAGANPDPTPSTLRASQ